MSEHRATQDRIIDDAIRKCRELTVYLKSGTSIKGTVIAHDSYTLFMNSGSNQTLIFKHFITSIYPARFIRND